MIRAVAVQRSGYNPRRLTGEFCHASAASVENPRRPEWLECFATVGASQPMRVSDSRRTFVRTFGWIAGAMHAVASSSMTVVMMLPYRSTAT